MSVLKAGCILVDVNTNNIGLIYRKKQGDYTFPKGHLEEGETLEECAVRETEEETGRKCRIVSSEELGILRYITPMGEDAEVHIFLAVDEGKSPNVYAPELVEELVWVNIEGVEKILTYQNLKELWDSARPKVDGLIEKIKA